MLAVGGSACTPMTRLLVARRPPAPPPLAPRRTAVIDTRHNTFNYAPRAASVHIRPSRLRLHTEHAVRGLIRPIASRAARAAHADFPDKSFDSVQYIYSESVFNKACQLKVVRSEETDRGSIPRGLSITLPRPPRRRGAMLIRDTTRRGRVIAPIPRLRQDFQIRC